jgi:hypothetical protein
MCRKNRETAWALLLTLVFLAAAGYVASRHEIWRDEAQAWLLAKESRSLDDLALRIKFDGHPAAWYWGLFILTRFTSSPRAMQLWHLLLAAAAVFLFARFAPFPWTARALFPFGYFAFYEYGVIARNYAIGALALFLFCAVWKQRRKSLLLPAFAILFLSQTNSVIFVIAVALTLVLAGEAIVLRRAGRPRFLAFAAVVVLIGLGIGMYQSLPDPASIYAKNIDLQVQPQKAYVIFRLIGKTYLSVPAPGPLFWGTSILNRSSAAPIITPLLSAVFLLFALLVLLDRPRALAFYIMATGALGAFYCFAYLGYTRHHGALFLTLLAALWLGEEEPPFRLPGKALGAAAGWARRKALPAVLIVLLTIQAAGAAVAVRYDLDLPFSQAERAAMYIREQGLTDRILVGDVAYTMSTISAFLDRPIYLPRLEQWGTYTPWIRAAHENTGMTEILAAAERLSRETGRDFLIILNYPLGKESLMSRRLRPVASFGGAIVESENFYLYQLEKRTLGVRS